MKTIQLLILSIFLVGLNLVAKAAPSPFLSFLGTYEATEAECYVDNELVEDGCTLQSLVIQKNSKPTGPEDAFLLIETLNNKPNRFGMGESYVNLGNAGSYGWFKSRGADNAKYYATSWGPYTPTRSLEIEIDKVDDGYWLTIASKRINKPETHTKLRAYHLKKVK